MPRKVAQILGDELMEILGILELRLNARRHDPRMVEEIKGIGRSVLIRMPGTQLNRAVYYRKLFRELGSEIVAQLEVPHHIEPSEVLLRPLDDGDTWRIRIED